MDAAVGWRSGENRTNVARAAWNKPSQNCPVARTVKSCRKRADPRTWRSSGAIVTSANLPECNQSAPDAQTPSCWGYPGQIGLGNPNTTGFASRAAAATCRGVGPSGRSCRR